MTTFHELTEQMLDYRESLGYCRSTYEWHLRNLERYVETNVDFDGVLRVDDILPWCERRPVEKGKSYRIRVTYARKFTEYLYAMGLCDRELPPMCRPVEHERPAPYIFTDEELGRLFAECDRAGKNHMNPLYPDIISVIYRLIFFCGLRPNEGRELLRKDVHLDDGTLYIRHNKAHKPRLIPMAEDVTEMCRKYASKRDVVFPDSDYFFPSPKGIAYGRDWLCDNFTAIWRKAVPEKSDARVRVYDLRHRFATTVMADWMDSGEDLYSILPYLSAYMGHVQFADTAYYIHLLPERLRNSPNFDFQKFSEAYPEEASHEEDD